MRDAQTLNPSVYFPIHMKEKLFAIYDNVEDYFGSIEDRAEPDIELLQSIATELGCTLDDARLLFDYLLPFVSIEELMEDAENEFLFTDGGNGHDKMVAAVECSLEGEELHGYLRSLSPREEEVLRLRYGIGFEKKNS